MSDGFLRIDSFEILDAKIVSKQAPKQVKSEKAKGKSSDWFLYFCLLPFRFCLRLEPEAGAELELPGRRRRRKAERVGRRGKAIAARRAVDQLRALGRR